jgi:hypothetical protein
MTPLLAGLAAWWLQCAILLGAGLVVPAVLGLRIPEIRLRLGQALLCAALLLPVLQPRRAAPPAGAGASAVALLAITAAEPSAQSPRSRPSFLPFSRPVQCFASRSSPPGSFGCAPSGGAHCPSLRCLPGSRQRQRG